MAKIKIEKKKSKLDEQGRKFVYLMQTNEWVDFLKWLEMIREELSSIDNISNTVEEDSQNSIFEKGLQVMVKRNNIAFLDKLVMMLSNFNKIYNKKTTEE